MTSKSAGFGSKTVGTQPPLKYWALLAAIRAVMRDASDPATVLDALLQEPRPTQYADDGKRIYPSRGIGAHKP